MNETIAMLEKLAEKLGSTGEVLFKYLVERQFILGLTNTIGGLLFAFMGIYVIRVIFLKWNKIANEDFEFPATLGGLLALIIVIIGVVCFFNGITYILAPEGETIIKLLESIK